MTALRMRILIFIALGALTTFAQATAGDFDLLHWEMSQSEVKRLHPNFEEWAEERITIFTGKRVVLQRVGLKSYNVGGCEFTLKLEFPDDQLSQIILDQHDDDEAICSHSVIAQLTKRYGGPPVVGSTSTDHTYRWETADTAIVLRISRLSDKREFAKLVYTSKASMNRPMRPSGTSNVSLQSQCNRDAQPFNQPDMPRQAGSCRLSQTLGA